jgi:FkbM family methyltransferase
VRFDAMIAAAYAEVMGRFGLKPDLRRRFNRVMRRPIEADFNVFRFYRNPEGMVYLDVGAHRGATIEAVRLFQPRLPVVAFEPNPVRIETLRQRFADDRAVVIAPCGLGDRTGTFDLFVPYYKGAAFDGLASLHREEAESALKPERIWGFDRAHLEIRTFGCKVRRLDEFALKPGFIKIDVQGAEAAVITGGHDTIAACKPVILMENNQPESDAAALFEQGYEAYALHGDRLDRGQLGSLNTFYIHPERRSVFPPALYA